MKISKNGDLNQSKGPLTIEELLYSKYHWIRVPQNQTFAKEINALKSDTTVYRNSKTKHLLVRILNNLNWWTFSLRIHIKFNEALYSLTAKCNVTSLILTYEHKYPE